MSQHYAVLTTGAPVMAVKVGVRSVPSPLDGSIQKLVFSIGQTNAEGAARFDFRINGVSIFASPEEQPVIVAGQKTVAVTGLEVSIEETDVLSWDAVSVPLGGLSAPVTCTAVLDDGQPAGVPVAEVDGAPSGTATLIRVANGDLEDLGGGVFRLKTAGDVVLPETLPPSGSAGGDLDGDYPDPTVQKLNGSALPAFAPNGFLKRNAADDAFEMIGFGSAANTVTEGNDSRLSDSRPPTGAAGGDLSGTFPSPSVSGLRGRSLGGIPAPGATFSDDFADNTFDSELWTRTSSGDVVEQNARIEVRNANFLTFNSSGVNMTDKYIQCEMQGAGGMIFRIVHTSDAEGENIQITNDGSDLKFQKRTSSSTTTITTLAYDATAHKFVRVEHVSASGLWVCSTSPTGAAGTWTVRSSFAPSLTVTSVLPRWYCTSGSFQYFDNITSNINATDPITNKNLFAVMWEQAGNQFSMFRTLGVIELTSGAPSGAPSNVPAGYTVLMYDAAAHTLYAWNGSTWDSQAF